MKWINNISIGVFTLFIFIIILINLFLHTEPYGISEKIRNRYRDVRIYGLLNSFNYERIFSEDIDPRNIDFFLDFSLDDKKFLDSTIELAVSSRSLYFKPEWKTWRNVDIRIKNKTWLKAKLKLHGSHALVYKKGYSSYNIKLNSLFDSDEFKLISSVREGTFSQIYYNFISNKLKVLAPDPGYIAVVNDGHRIVDMRFTRDLSKSYLHNKLGHNNYTILKMNSDWHRQSGHHVSPLQINAGYLDNKLEANDSLAFMYFNYFLTKNPKLFDKIDNDEWGRFLAVLFLWYESHPVMGDNALFIYDKERELFRPILRHEGGNSLIAANSDFLNTLFTRRPQNHVFDILKWLLISPNVLRSFQSSLYKLTQESIYFHNALDSIFESSQRQHLFNPDYDQIKTDYEKLHLLIDNNLNAIIDYTVNCQVIVNEFKNLIEIQSDSNSPLTITLSYDDNSSHVFNNINFIIPKIEKNQIVSELSTFIIKKNSKKRIKSIEVLNFTNKKMIANDKLIVNNFDFSYPMGK